MNKSKHSIVRALDWGSWATLVLTVILFTLALIEKGWTHDMLLEAGVFLISVKLVLATSKTHVLLKSLSKKVDALQRDA